MRLPFCDHHICAFLQNFAIELKPLDIALSEYFRSHKSIGAHDRRAIGETIYGMTRWKSLIDYFCLSTSPMDRLFCYRKLPFGSLDLSIPEAIRFGMNEYLYKQFCHAFGRAEAQTLCQILNGQAPTTIRTNLAKITREELLQKFGEEAFPCTQAKAGIQFKKRMALFSTPEFKQGLFEMQDEGSQLVAELIQLKPGEHILDYCSGSGGKTLAFAHQMKGKGQIYLHDIRPRVLQEAKKRLKRAGVQNAQFLPPAHPQLSALKEKIDWILADVPCSGTGTLRRNPDAKWKIDAAMIGRLVEDQRKIVEEALSYLKKGGYFLYATCSVLPQENEEQTSFFLKKYSLSLEKPPLSLWPVEGGMDGFYSALFRKI